MWLSGGFLLAPTPTAQRAAVRDTGRRAGPPQGESVLPFKTD